MIVGVRVGVAVGAAHVPLPPDPEGTHRGHSIGHLLSATTHGPLQTGGGVGVAVGAAQTPFPPEVGLQTGHS